MDRPALSIIIPVYNAEKYICRCLDSVIAQPMANIEIVCVDDGSTDNSPHILERYVKNDCRIRVLHQKNMHSGIARNNGLNMATGDYIHFLDADDVLTTDAYNVLYKKAKEFNLDYARGKAYTVDVLTGNIIENEMTSMGCVSRKEYNKVVLFSELPEIFTQLSYAPWNGIYRREFLINKEVYFDDSLAFDDHIFYYEVLIRAKKIMFVDHYMLYYNKGNEKSLVSNYIKLLGCHFESFDKIKSISKDLSFELQKIIFNTELRSVFTWYRKSAASGEAYKQNHKLMLSFVQNLDSSLLEAESYNEIWYLEYLLLLKESVGKTKELDLEKIVKITAWKYLLEIIPKNSTVVIYTAGYSGQMAYRILTETQHCKVSLWVDRDYKSFQDMGLPVYSPDELDTCFFDYILIAARAEKTMYAIKDSILKRKIPDEKLLWYDSRLEYFINHENIRNFISKTENNSRLIIYGAAKIGETVVKFLQCLGKEDQVIGIGVTDKDRNPSEIMGIPVTLIKDLLSYKENALVLIATSWPYHDEISANLISLGFNAIYPISTSTKDLFHNIVMIKQQESEKKRQKEVLYQLKNISTQIQHLKNPVKREMVLRELLKEWTSDRLVEKRIKEVGGCDILFVSPPSWDMYSPFSAVPCLVAKLQEQKYTCEQVDLGIYNFHTALERNWKKAAERFRSLDYYRNFVCKYERNPYNSYERYLDALWFFEDDKKFPFNEVKQRYIEMNRIQVGVIDRFYNDIYRYTVSAFDFNHCNDLQFMLENTDFSLLWNTILDNDFLPLFFYAPGVVGISITGTDQFLSGCFLAKLIKTCRPDIKTVMGGSCADIFFCSKYKHKADIFQIFDYIIAGEGETALTMLVEYIKKGEGVLKNIPNLIYCTQEGQIMHGEEYLEDVESLPAPCYDGLDFSLYLAPEPILPYQSSRGCHYGQCAFCNHNEKYRHNYRTKTVEKATNDLLLIRNKYNIQNIQFVDEAIRADYFGLLVREMDKYSEFKKMHWIYYSRVSRQYTEETLNIARRNGCEMVMFGVETMNQRLLKLIKKGISGETSQYCLKLFKKCGIKTFAWLMCNLPSETVEEMRADIDEIKALKEYLDCISVSPFYLDVNTDMYRDMASYHITDFEPTDGYSFISKNNGEIIDKKEIFKIYSEEYAPLGQKLFFVNNRYIIFFNCQ